MQCNPLLQDLLNDNVNNLAMHPDVVQFYSTLRAASKDEKVVYFLLRAKPNTRLSKSEFVRRIFYVGQAEDIRRRLLKYHDTLDSVRETLSKGERVNKREVRDNKIAF